MRSLALAIACDIHPLNNLRVLRYLQDTLGVDAERRPGWYRQWVKVGFTALEQLLARRTHAGEFCHGDSPTMADCFLLPQVFNAQRLQCPLDNYPALMHIHANCEDLEAFQRAAPGMQFDADQKVTAVRTVGSSRHPDSGASACAQCSTFMGQGIIEMLKFSAWHAPPAEQRCCSGIAEKSWRQNLFDDPYMRSRSLRNNTQPVNRCETPRNHAQVCSLMVTISNLWRSYHCL